MTDGPIPKLFPAEARLSPADLLAEVERITAALRELRIPPAENEAIVCGAIAGVLIRTGVESVRELPCSPVGLPGELAVVLGADLLADLVSWHEREGSLVDQHFGAGMLVRNAMRRLGAQWTDQELDDGWERVVLSIIRGRRAAAEPSTTCTGVHHGEA